MQGLVGSVVGALASLILGVSVGGSTVPANPVQLAADLNVAQQLIDARSSSTTQLTSAGRFIQLATRELRAQSSTARRATLARLDRPTLATMRANLAAAAALSALNPPRKALPAWRIIQSPKPNTLLGYFKAAQSRFGVRWEYLAAIEMIETHFGRVDGLSTVGAEGPMQFMQSTWGAYGIGNVHNPRDAIFGAARYLVASGAPRDMAGAIFHYNPSKDYVRAVEAYASRMRSDPRIYYGYYYWQVLFAKVHGTFILPLGYPKVKAIRLG